MLTTNPTAAPKGHWSHYWETDQAAECLPYARDNQELNDSIYNVLWNGIGPETTLGNHWGTLTQEQRDALDKAYAAEYDF